MKTINHACFKLEEKAKRSVKNKKQFDQRCIHLPLVLHEEN